MANSTTQITQITPSSINPDMVWGHISMLLINKMNISMNKFNMKTILKLVLLVCLFEIKVGCIDLLKFIKGNSKDWIIKIYNIMRTCMNKIYDKLSFRHKMVCDIDNETHKHMYKLTVSNEILQLFIKYIENSKCASYFKYIDDKITCTKKDVEIQNIYKNVQINSHSCIFHFTSEINSCYNNIEVNNSNSNNIIIIKFEGNNINTNKELFSIIFKSDVWTSVNAYCSIIEFKNTYESSVGYGFENMGTTLCSLLNVINSIYNKICIPDIKKIYIYFLSMYKYFYLTNSQTNLKILQQYITNILETFYNSSILITPFGFHIDCKMLNIISVKSLKLEEIQNFNDVLFFKFVKYEKNDDYIYNELLKTFNKYVVNNTPHFNINTDEQQSNTNKELKFYMINESDKFNDEEQIKLLLNTIMKENVPNSKITTYCIKIDEKEIIEEIENPEYSKYLENKELIEKIISKSDNLTGGLMNIPDKTIKKSSIKKIVSSTKIKEQQKSFNTLYLQQSDENMLHQILENYTNNVFSEFELPKKLGIMLYGEPGTGKSTTIQVIGSYLKKDIYFVNISNVKTCGELKQIFDDVVGKCSGSGIIVFEDIDAQTDIVKRRDGEYLSPTISSLIDTQDDKLNLAYFLNLLDGSLCAEDTIFIMTTNHIEHLDPAIYRHGRIDCKIELKACDHYQIQKIYKTIIKENIDKNVLSRIPEYKYTPSEIIYWLANCSYNKTDCENMMKKFLQQ